MFIKTCLSFFGSLVSLSHIPRVCPARGCLNTYRILWDLEMLTFSLDVPWVIPPRCSFRDSSRGSWRSRVISLYCTQLSSWNINYETDNTVHMLCGGGENSFRPRRLLILFYWWEFFIQIYIEVWPVSVPDLTQGTVSLLVKQRSTWFSSNYK